MKYEKYQIEHVSIDVIDDPSAPVRTRHDDSALHDLAVSIRTMGIIEPLVVCRRGERFEVIAGHRRLLAARIAGLAAVPCVLRNVSAHAVDVLKLHENLFREDINPVDEGRFLSKMINDHDLNIEKLSEMIKRSETYIRERVNMIEWDPAVLDAVEQKKLQFSAAKYIAKIANESTRKQYLNYAVRGGITTIQARIWAENAARDTLPAEPTDQIIEDLKTGEEKVELTVPCVICGEDIPVAEARLFYAHPGCIETINQ